jgi:hypothetical protein
MSPKLLGHDSIRRPLRKGVMQCASQLVAQILTFTTNRVVSSVAEWFGSLLQRPSSRIERKAALTLAGDNQICAIAAAAH